MKMRYLVATILLLAAARTGADTKDVEVLLDGVTKIAAPGVPGPLCVFGDGAFAVVTGGSGNNLREPVVAAARMGKGRAVAFGHTDYFNGRVLGDNATDTGRLMTNAVRWAAGAAAKPVVGVHRAQGLLAFLKRQGFKTVSLAGADWLKDLRGASVLCIDTAGLGGTGTAPAVSRFIKAGGGLVAMSLGWGWKQVTRKDLVTEHAGNRLLGPAGIVWADGTLKHTAEGGYAAGAAPPPLVHAGCALEALATRAGGKKPLSDADAAQAAAVVTRAVRSLPAGDRLLLPQLGRLEKTHQADTVPTARRPLTAKNPLGRLLLTLQVQEAGRAAPEKVRAHPAAAEFPGPVPADATRVTRTVAIDTRVPDWHSTGLYAAPGERLTVTVPAAAVGKQLAVRIGAHRDRLWHHDRWRRVPEICRQFPIGAPTTPAANAFGGLVYIVVPRGCDLGTLKVTVRGAVEAPYYVHGVTEVKRWREAVRRRPAPWAELASKKVILTLPSKVVRDLDDPKGVMDFWDGVMDACARLAAWPLERPRPERYVPDVQISAGYMHSGYPIMTLLDMPPVMVDKARLMTGKHGGVWGLFHEMGHNHQSRDWTFGGTVEVTVNLFTMYVFETVCGMEPTKAHGSISDRSRAGKMKGYFAAPDFEKWKRDPFLGLIMYIQMQKAFGWDAFKKVFAEYRALPRNERPRSDDDRRDQWMVRLSRTVGRNLGPFFEAWHVPTSEKARASIAALPKWMPEGFPPKGS